MIKVYRRVRRWVLRLLGVASRKDIADLRRELRTLARGQAKLLAGQTKVLARLLRVLEKSNVQGRRLKLMQHQLGTSSRGLEGRLRHVERNVHALIRHDYVDQAALPFPHNVLSQRFHVRSQNEEDGITLALVTLVGPGARRFVDLGAGTNGGNCGFLADTCGWTGLMVDGSAARAARLAARFGQFEVLARQAWITTDNVNALVRDNGMSDEIDLLSLDVDGNDYWIWQRLDACSPRIVILEFNPGFGAERAVTVQYDPAFDRANFRGVTWQYYGASLAAFVRLGHEKGYRLVLVEPRGQNAYFLRNDVGTAIPEASPATLHPDPTLDPQPLFDQIAAAGLPLVDLDHPDGAPDEQRGG